MGNMYFLIIYVVSKLMTVSFADPFDIAQFSKKYSVILKSKRGDAYSMPLRVIKPVAAIAMTVTRFSK